jgi:di/tricarboxylate transporter
MVTMSAGIAMLSLVIGLGIIFLLWALYHFIQESRNPKSHEELHAHVNRSMESLGPEDRKLLLRSVVRTALLLPFTPKKVQASSHRRHQTEELQQQVFSLRRRIDTLQEELEQRSSTGKSLPLTRTAQRN